MTDDRSQITDHHTLVRREQLSTRILAEPNDQARSNVAAVHMHLCCVVVVHLHVQHNEQTTVSC